MKQADVKKIDFPEDEQAGLSGQDSIVTHRVSDEADKFKAGDIVESSWGDKYEVSDRKDVSKVEDSPYYKELTDSQKALLKVYNRIAVLRLKRQEKKADAHHPDFDHVVKLFKDRYGIDLSHVRMKWSVHPRYNDGRVSHEFPDDEHGGSHGRLGDDCVVWINPKMRPVMNKFNVPGKVRDFRKLIMAHELAHDIDSHYSRAYNPKFVKKMVEEAKKNNFRTAYTDTYDPVKMPNKFDKELFAEYMAHLLTQPSEKKAEDTVSMSRDRIQAQYARHPQESLARLAARLAKKKWGPEDVRREYESHSREYDETKEDKEFLDRYIIARIGEKYDREARIKQALMRKLWEKEHNGESFDAALPARMARFRQYEGVPFPAASEKKAEQVPSEEDLRRMYDIVQSDAKLTRRIEGLGFGRDGDAYRKAAIRLRVMELAKVLRDGKRVRNRIVHAPGYIPSKQDADRALQQYADAHAGLTRFLNDEERMTQEGK